MTIRREAQAARQPDEPRALIGYVRVSSTQQGRSGLGIEAQQAALEHFAASEDFRLSQVFVEVETGKGENVLGHPALVLSQLARLLATQPAFDPLAPGEIITTKAGNSLASEPCATRGGCHRI